MQTQTQTPSARFFPGTNQASLPIAPHNYCVEVKVPDLYTASFPAAYSETYNKVVADAAMVRYLQDLKTAATEKGIGIVHIFEAGEKGGLTIAFKKSTGFKSGRMVQVSVATCSVEDHFNKKIGVRVALEKFFYGETIELPILKDYSPEYLNYAVKAAFTALYQAV